MSRINRLITLLRLRGYQEALRVVLNSCLERLNGDNNDDPSTNGEFALLRAYLQPGMVAFDVGANLGNWTMQALAIQPSLRIYAFEPVSHLFESIHQRFAGDKRVICTNVVLADQAGQSEIYLDRKWSGSNSLFCRGLFSEFRTETVTAATGDAFVVEHRLGAVDFLKLDVEGAEVKVIQGFRETFARRQIGLCQLEYGGTYIDARVFLRDIFTFADQVGYGVAKLLPSRVRFLEHYDPTLENFKYANFLLYRDAALLPRGFA
jgi:FkbM family methyltransferase